MPPIKPRRLAPGQTVGLVAPSSAPNEPERIRFAAETIESLGFRVKLGAHLRDRDRYLAGSDAARAHDLKTMFADDAVDAIWCVRGGYGASRLLPALDYELIRRRPKPLIGYSDITALHMALQRPVGLRGVPPLRAGRAPPRAVAGGGARSAGRASPLRAARGPGGLGAPRGDP